MSDGEKISTLLARSCGKTFEISRESNFQRAEKEVRRPLFMVPYPWPFALVVCLDFRVSKAYIPERNIGVHRALSQPFKRRTIAKPASSHRPLTPSDTTIADTDPHNRCLRYFSKCNPAFSHCRYIFSHERNFSTFTNNGLHFFAKYLLSYRELL